MKILFFSFIRLTVFTILVHASEQTIDNDDKLKLVTTSSASKSTEERHDYIKAKQIEWAQHYIEARNLIISANPRIEPLTSFSKLSIIEKPHPELFQLYFRNNEQEPYNLVKDSSSK